MRSKIKYLLLVSIILFSFTVSSNQKVIYGEDNRVELNQSAYGYLKNSVASMIYKNQLFEDDDDYLSTFLVSLLTTYRESPTCDELRFRDQPRLATCSGFLIADDLIVTAGHCVLDFGQYANNTYVANCSQSEWVFNYSNESIYQSEARFKRDDIYECDKIVDGAYTDTKDYAIVKLRRKTVGKTPVKLNLNYDYNSKDEVFVVGNPSGLPTKLAANAFVFDSSEKHFFKTNLDTFAGNSGSAIFNNKAEVIGILVSGEVDYSYDVARDCYTTNKCLGINQTCIDPQVQNASGETGTKITVLNRYFSKH